MKKLIHNIVSWYRWNIKHGVSNLIYYFDVIWKQRDFDHQYMEELFLVKLKRQYKHYHSKNCVQYERMEKDIQSMKICIDILERRKNEWYVNMWYDNPDRESQDQSSARRLLELTYKTEQRDWKIFCSILEKYLPRWWD